MNCPHRGAASSVGSGASSVGSAAATVGSAAEQQQTLWRLIQAYELAPRAPVVYPDTGAVLLDVAQADYSATLLDPRDHDHAAADLAAAVSSLPPPPGTPSPPVAPPPPPPPPPKVGAIGAVCLARIEWFAPTGDAGAAAPPYTGLFEAAEHCVVRMSNALEPPGGLGAVLAGSAKRSVLFPCVAIKCLRGGGAPSGNLLFAGRKTGQVEPEFFAHAVCTHVSEKVAGAMRWVLERFRRYSAYPTGLGLSDFAGWRADGERAPSPRFPWCLVLLPSAARAAAAAASAAAGARAGAKGSVDHPGNRFLKELASLEPGSILYDIFAVPTPGTAATIAREADAGRAAAASGMVRIGRLVSTTHFVRTGARLRFRHQAKEEDYACESAKDWVDPGGTGHAAAGYKIFEARLRAGDFVDWGGGEA